MPLKATMYKITSEGANKMNVLNERYSKGKTIKMLRKQAGYTQKFLASEAGMTPGELSNIECGKLDVGLFQLMRILELTCSFSSEIWLTCLDDLHNYQDYKMYTDIKRYLRMKDYDNVKLEVEKLEESKFSRSPFIRQFLTWIRIYLDDTSIDEVVISKLEECWKQTKPRFNIETAHNYNLNYNDFNILYLIADKMFEVGDKKEAIALLQNIIATEENSWMPDIDKYRAYPALMNTLANMLGKCGRFTESLQVCKDALAYCKKYDTFTSGVLPSILYNMALNYKHLKIEKDTKKILMRAYYIADGMGNCELAETIATKAKENFGFSLELN